MSDDGEEEASWLRELIAYNREALCCYIVVFCSSSVSTARQAPAYDLKKRVDPIKGHAEKLLTRPHRPGRASLATKSTHWSLTLGDDVLSLSRTSQCFDMIEQDDRLDYALPKRARLTAGQILKHCYETLDRILAKQTPCIYKVGYTHCAWFRFYNDVFGYVRERDRWECMTVIYAASEITSPSFVEAALIQREKGGSVWFSACVHVSFL